MFKNLSTFKMVYETRSFSRAAELLFIAQPTVSAQIKQLESELGTQLFIRNGRGEVGVTPAADKLYTQAAQLLSSWAELHATVSGTAMRRSTCRIASSHTFATYLLPQVLPVIVHQYPTVQFSVHMGNSQNVQDALLHHNADLGFIEKPLASSELRRVTLLDDQLVHAGSSGPWLTREPDSGVYYYTKRFMEEMGITEPTIEIDNNAMIVNLLHAGFGQSIISARAAEGIDHVVLDAQYRRQFYMLSRIERNDSEQALDDIGTTIAKLLQPR